MTVQLQPLDIIVTVDESQAIFNRLKRRLMGPYCHVLLYMGCAADIDVVPGGRSALLQLGAPAIGPLVFETLGSGPVLRHIANYEGRLVVVTRSVLLKDERLLVMREAMQLLGDRHAVYDYTTAGGLVVWRLVCEHLRLPLPLKYHRDQAMICSELVAECFWRAGVGIVSQDVVPMPADFVPAPRPWVRDRWFVRLGPESWKEPVREP